MNARQRSGAPGYVDITDADSMEDVRAAYPNHTILYINDGNYTAISAETIAAREKRKLGPLPTGRWYGDPVGAGRDYIEEMKI